MSKLRNTISFISPAKPIADASKSLVRMRDALRGMADEMKNGLEKPVPIEEIRGALEAAQDGKQRFAVLYEAGAWTQPELDEQLKAVHRTKLACLASSAVALAAIISAAIFLPLWMYFFIMPMLGCMLILALAQSFKFALYEAQLELKDIITAKKFVSLPDFWPRYLG